MMLPNADSAVVEIAKLRDYCLNLGHQRGRHKARVFASALGLTSADAEWLKEQLLVAARTGVAVPAEADEYGARYVLDFIIRNTQGEATIRSAWIVRTGENFPRLTSCYVL